MKDNKKQIFIAGLGRFGQSLAVNLLEQGAEVFGVDARESMVEEIADQLTHSAIANTTDPKVMARLGLADFDAAVCAIGSDLEASLMTTLLMKVPSTLSPNPPRFCTGRSSRKQGQTGSSFLRPRSLPD